MNAHRKRREIYSLVSSLCFHFCRLGSTHFSSAIKSLNFFSKSLVSTETENDITKDDTSFLSILVLDPYFYEHLLSYFRFIIHLKSSLDQTQYFISFLRSINHVINHPCQSEIMLFLFSINHLVFFSEFHPIVILLSLISQPVRQ